MSRTPTASRAVTGRRAALAARALRARLRPVAGGADGGERGSMSVEMIVLVPVLLLIVMIAVAGGRLVSAEGMVQAAARDAARAASTVSCRVELSDLGLVFLPGATTVTASSTAPVDTWRGTR